MGNTAYFNVDNAPKGAAARCVNCKYIETCPYSAKKIYLDTWKQMGMPELVWPHLQITSADPITEEALLKAMREGPYGRCVFACDNDAVDHQIVEMTFENGVKASLTMMGFTAKGGRRISFYGTDGEIELCEELNYIKLKRFGMQEECVDLTTLVAEGATHGGGDEHLIAHLYGMLAGEIPLETSLEHSIESHLMGIAAEDSRLAGGALKEMKDYRGL